MYDILTVPRIYNFTNVAVSATKVSTTPVLSFTINSMKIMLHGFSISVNTTFQTNCQWKLEIDGVDVNTIVTPTSTGADWQGWDVTSQVLQLVPAGKALRLQPNAGIRIYAYNSVGTGSPTFSVYAVADLDG